jgi:predicted membrane-bound mannosyltransferase
MRLREQHLFSAVLFGAVACGAFLRLYLLPGQILLDDEWHALNYVLGRSFAFLATHFSVPGATSVPMNLYTRLLLETTGWSETMLRLPAVLAGLLSLLVLPPLVRRIFGTPTAMLFAVLLAISPFLLFYSRSARPYGVVLLLASVSMLSCWLWTATGRRRWAVAWAVCAVLSTSLPLSGCSFPSWSP